MKLTLGRTLDGLPVGLRTDTPARVAMVGVPDSGKTTACRRLIRRWHSLGAGPVGVLTARPEQYLDLPVDRMRRGGEVAGEYGLLVIDEADLQGTNAVAGIWRARHRVVVLAGWGSHLPTIWALGPQRVPAILLVDHRRPPQFMNLAGARHVLLDPITAADVDPVRRRSYLGGVFLDDADLDDVLDPVGAASWPPEDELAAEVPA